MNPEHWNFYNAQKEKRPRGALFLCPFSLYDGNRIVMMPAVTDKSDMQLFKPIFQANTAAVPTERNDNTARLDNAADLFLVPPPIAVLRRFHVDRLPQPSVTLADLTAGKRRVI